MINDAHKLKEELIEVKRQWLCSLPDLSAELIDRCFVLGGLRGSAKASGEAARELSGLSGEGANFVHSLRGSCETFNFEKGAALCKALESSLRSLESFGLRHAPDAPLEQEAALAGSNKRPEANMGKNGLAGAAKPAIEQIAQTIEPETGQALEQPNEQAGFFTGLEWELASECLALAEKFAEFCSEYVSEQSDNLNISRGNLCVRMKFKSRSPSYGLQEKRNVLLYEDDAILAREIGAHLKYFGWHVETALTEESLRSKLSGMSFDAVVSDIVFPHGALAGPEAIAKAFGDYKLQIPVVYVSMRSDIEARLQCLRSGGCGFLSKPVDPDRLASLLESVCAKEASEDPYRILLVEDTKALGTVYQKALSHAGHSVRLVTDPMGVLDALGDFNAELVVLDQGMPGASGHEIVKLLRQQEDYVGVQIAFLSSTSGVEARQAALDLGADDYFEKSQSLEHIIRMIGARAKRCREVRSFMVCDSLTGALNHARLKEALMNEFNRSKRSRRHFCYAMLDIDFFKKVNDTHGHACGDAVLQSLSRMLRQRLRKTDVIGRYGGEEFGLILPDTPKEGAEKILEILRQDFSQMQHGGKDGLFNVTVSIGVAFSGDYLSAGELAESADAALYEAKRSGRNRLVSK